MQYTVIVEQGPRSWGACVPDLPGCVAAGESLAEVLRLIRDAISFHIEDLIGRREPVPMPHSSSELVEVDAS